MKELHAEISIAAPAERVWQVLTDFDAYPEWNPFIKRIEGHPNAGAKLDVRIEPPDGREMTFEPTILNVEPERELRWLGRLVAPRIFDGEHSFRIQPTGEGQVRFVQAEEFRGLLVPLFGRRTLARTRAGFVLMNEALKRRAESD